MVTHPPSPSKAPLGMSTSDARLPRVTERSMVPHRQRARTPILHRDEPLLPLTPDVPSTQTPLEHPNSDCGRCSSDPSSTPNAGYSTTGKAGALQPSDRNPTHPQLQRSHPRIYRPQSPHPADPSDRSSHRRNLSLREPTKSAPEGSRFPRHTQNRPQTPESRASVPQEILPDGYRKWNSHTGASRMKCRQQRHHRA